MVWSRTSDGSPARILPDGCIDLMWYGDALVVAGPDTIAFESGGPRGTVAAGVRFPPGMAPSVLGVPAHALRDERVALAELWSRDDVGRLEERIAATNDLPHELELIAVEAARRAPAVDAIVAEVA